MKLESVGRHRASTRRTMRRQALLATALVTLGATAAQALPVIPGGAGYGIETPAGRGGTVYRVTNLNADGAGSLKACVDGATARTCIFEVSGTIRLTTDLTIRNSRITIAGQTAPSPGITIRGVGIKIQASDVLIQHIRVRTGDAVIGPDPDNRDSLKIQGSDIKPVRNIVIDHCSFSWAIDETVSAWGPHDNITFSNNIFSEPLNESMHSSYDGAGVMPHGFGVLLGSAPNSSITMVGNLMAHQVERNPLSRAAQFVFVNNLVYNRGTMDLDLQSESSRVTYSTVVGNVFRRGPNFSRATYPILVHTIGPVRLYSGSRVYVRDNLSDQGNTYSTTVHLAGGDVIPGLMTTTTMPVWNSGLTAMPTADNAVYYHVLWHAGARPKDRDTVDKRLKEDVRYRTGQIINCVLPDGSTRCSKNAGGWPTLAYNRRALTLPSNPNGIASNGYTNLENWLHTMDRALSGTVASTSPTSPASLSVQ
jgi:pectate lyase